MFEMLENVGAADEIERLGRKRKQLAVCFAKRDRGMREMAACKPDAQGIAIDREHRSRTSAREDRRPIACATACVENTCVRCVGCRELVEGFVRHEEIVADTGPDGLVERTKPRCDLPYPI